MRRIGTLESTNTLPFDVYEQFFSPPGLNDSIKSGISKKETFVSELTTEHAYSRTIQFGDEEHGITVPIEIDTHVLFST